MLSPGRSPFSEKILSQIGIVFGISKGPFDKALLSGQAFKAHSGFFQRSILLGRITWQEKEDAGLRNSAFFNGSGKRCDNYRRAFRICQKFKGEILAT